jgi:type I restriction enzyme S subunit
MRLEKVKLGDILEYEQPTNYIVDSVNYEDGFSTPVLTAGKSFILGYTDEITGVFNNLPVIIFDDFTTAFHYVDFPFKVKSSAMKILKPVKERADLKYLYYKMQTISLDTDLHKRYWISTYSQIQIPLPPLPQQQKIANILDAADALRQNDKVLIAKYDELTQALFLDMFGDPVSNPKGWEKVELKKCTSKIGSGSTPRGGKETYITEGIALIRSLNIYDNEFKYKNLAYISQEQADKLNNVIVESSDVLFNITGASVCRCSIVPDDVLPARVNQHVSILRPIKEKLSSSFLSHLLISENVKIKLLGVGSFGGAVMEAITKEQLEKIEVILPSIDLQNQFAERVALIEEQKAIAQKSLEKSESLFNSLLQKAFKGEL